MEESVIRKIIREELSSFLQEIASPVGSGLIETNEAMKILGVTGRTSMARYHRQGLPYIKGTPNRYVKKDVIEFAMKKRICRQG